MLVVKGSQKSFQQMGLFGKNKELQFAVCNHGEPHVSLLKQQIGSSFGEGTGSWEELLVFPCALQST